MKTSDIRKTFLDFFASKGHTIVPSSSLVPQGDPTLLFTNAGMNQFKNVFLGLEERPYKRATTAQKCVRAGGKHNDLENVGYTARHHTFFEMLGNFSFGDYFKREAIAYAWELLTEVFKLPPERLWVTVYAEDDEAYRLWAEEIGVPRERIVRIGDNKGARYASDNFWMMGDTGPCGPCTEIFYDHGPEVPGGPPGSPDEDGDRYIEIWNLVFMQYNRDEQGEMHPLPKPSVDTGMGLERIAAVLQGVHSNYEIDLFQRLITAAMELTGCADRDQPSLKVLADHIRAASFLIADGVIPGNEGRGYVLRRIIRRAIRHGWKLGVRAPFFYRLVPALVAEMGEAYPELVARQAVIESTLKQEEERFFGTIEHGMSLLEAVIAQMQANGQSELDGEIAFKLHDTYGFPLDLTADVLRERGFTVDVAGFDAAMARQKAMARAAGKFKMQAVLEYEGPTTRFEGYETLEDEGEIVALYRDGAPVEELAEGEEGVVVLDRTPFYAESGGQAGDRGELRAPEGIFAVEDTQKTRGRSWRSIATARRSRNSPRARRAWWCSIARRSTPNPAARRAIAASCALRRGSSPSRIRRRSRPRCSAITAWCARGGSRWGSACAPVSMPRPAPPPRGTIPPRTSCTRLCAKCWGRTWSRKAHSSMPIACASTSRTLSRSARKRSSASNGSSIARCSPTFPRAPR